MIVAVVRYVVFASAMVNCVVDFLHLGGKHSIVVDCVFDDVALMLDYGDMYVVMSWWFDVVMVELSVGLFDVVVMGLEVGLGMCGDCGCWVRGFVVDSFVRWIPTNIG